MRRHSASARSSAALHCFLRQKRRRKDRTYCIRHAMGRRVSINSHVALALSQAPLLLRGSWRGPKPSQVHALDSGTLDICIDNASLPYAFARRLTLARHLRDTCETFGRHLLLDTCERLMRHLRDTCRHLPDTCGALARHLLVGLMLACFEGVGLRP